MQKQLQFSLDDISLFNDDEDQDFALAKLGFLSSGNKMNNCSISEDVLKNNANTVLGKFIVAEYDKWRDDVRGHTNTESIAGYVPPNSSVSFEEKDGRLFAVVDGVLSKLYATPIVQMFQKNDKRSVSCEFTADMGEEESNGDTPIEAFTIRAITILGKDIAPACKGATIEVMKFSKEDAENFYNKKQNTFSKLQEFAERRKLEFVEDRNYKVDTSRKSMSNGEWDGDKAKHDAINAKNFESIAPKIFLRLENGWKDKEVTKLGYPVMELKGDTWVYNAKGLASAEGYAKKENDTEIVNKVIKIKEKLGLNDDEEGEKEKMKDKKFEIEGREAWGEVINEVEKHEGKGVYVDSVEKDHIIYTKDKVRYRVGADVEVGKDDKKVHASIHWDTVKKDAEQKEFEDDKKKYPEDDTHSTDKKDDEEVEKDDEDTEKKMSLDANVDMAAYYEMLQNETDEYKTLAKKVLEEENRGLVMQDVLKMAKERDELKAFYDKKMAEEKECEFAKVMSEVKNDLTDKEFEDLKCEFENCEDITAFANKARAMAYISKKKNATPNDGEVKKFARMDFDFSTYAHQLNTVTADDVFKKYL